MTDTDMTDADGQAQYEREQAELWQTPTPYRVQFQFSDESDLKEFLGYMSDGGGEYGFCRNTAVTFHYFAPGDTHQAQSGVVKVIRWGHDSELED